MTPQQALSDIPGFGSAVVDGKIADGITANSWRVVLDGESYVLRIDTTEASALGLNRSSEHEAQAVAARAGLTPEPLFTDPERGISLRRWIAGRSWTEADLRIPSNIVRLGELLRRIHELPPIGAMYQPGEAATRYAEQLGSPQARQTAVKANQLLDEIRAEPAASSLCHNDLLAANLIDTGQQLVPIDWEYAGAGDPLFDLAVLIRHHRLEAGLSQRLVQACLGREMTNAEARRLKLWCRFYGLLLKLWSQRVGG